MELLVNVYTLLWNITIFGKSTIFNYGPFSIPKRLQFAIEHGPCMIDLPKLVIFHSYLSLPEGASVKLPEGIPQGRNARRKCRPHG